MRRDGRPDKCAFCGKQAEVQWVGKHCWICEDNTHWACEACDKVLEEAEKVLKLPWPAIGYCRKDALVAWRLTS